MANEVEQAAQLVLRWDREFDGGTTELAAKTVAKWALERLAADKAEREEQARTIDAEWLESIGFENRGAWLGKFVGGADLWWGGPRRALGINMHYVSSIKTRGQVLDLLRALKGGK